MYKLGGLGWYGFQQLCLTICRELLGQTVESFLDTRDGGRDGAFAGTWSPSQSETINGQFVIQCKFTARENYNLVLSDVSDEYEKVERLVEAGRCDVYVLMTNAGISGKFEKDFVAKLTDLGVGHVLCFGKTWICDQIRESKRLRMLVPRVYGLGDLGQILDERVYSQARELLDSMSEDLAKIVVTNTYRQAAAALDEHGFVLLIGDPAAGKTTIASLLAMSALDLWGASPMKLKDASAVIEHWNPEEPSQLFWVDDAFGVTQYESHLTQDWNHQFAHVKALLKQRKKIVMTSRNYIYNSARRDLKESAFPLLQESQVVIDVRDLSDIEKQQILYNHLRLGRQPKSFRKAIKPFLKSVAAHKRFIPETARRLGDPHFTKELSLYQSDIDAFVNNQESFLIETLNGLDANSRAALALIYMRNNILSSPIRLTNPETEAIARIGGDIAGCVDALNSLEESFVQRVSAGGDAFWQFRHPTIGDAFATSVAVNPELLEIYLLGISTEKLIYQVTCGDVDYEHAVILPGAFFESVIQRLDDFTKAAAHKSDWRAVYQAKDNTLTFLARRCSKSFLELYLESHNDLLDRVVAPGLYLHAVNEVDVAIRLYEFGLLPEAHRQKLVAQVSEYAIEGEDLYVLSNSSLRNVLTINELSNLRERIRDELVPNIDKIRERRQASWESGETPSDAMQPLLDVLDTLKSEYDDPDIINTVYLQEQSIHSWIDEEEEEDQDDKPARKSLSDFGKSDDQSGDRSIFDDVDA